MRLILLAATLLLPLPAVAQTVTYPSIPQPTAPNDVEGLLMQISSSTTLPATYYTTGIVFPDGAVPAAATTSRGLEQSLIAGR